jgi:hypothetical protein
MVKKSGNKIMINGRELKPYIWNLYNGHKTNDIDYYYSRMMDSGLKVEQMGLIENLPIFLVQNDHEKGQPNLLIMGGVHGEETAGPWGILNVLMKLKLMKIHVNLSFIPIMNPYGFSNGIRFNADLKSVNSGYFRTKSGKQELTTEGELLNKNFVRICDLARNGFLSCHEDVNEKHFFIYEVINGIKPDFYCNELQLIGNRYFGKQPDGPTYTGTVKDGVVLNEKDGTIDDYLFTVGGIHRAITTETPGIGDINKRVYVNEQLITKFIELYNAGRFFI